LRTVIINPKWLSDFENCGYVLEPGYLISSELLLRTTFRTSSYQLPILITALYWYSSENCGYTSDPVLNILKTAIDVLKPGNVIFFRTIFENRHHENLRLSISIFITTQY
jgi:hypothetical protein